MTIALNLDETSASALRLAADKLGLTPEQLATDVVQRFLQGNGNGTRTADEATFRAALAASTTENAELLRRLARA